MRRKCPFQSDERITSVIQPSAAMDGMSRKRQRIGTKQAKQADCQANLESHARSLLSRDLGFDLQRCARMLAREFDESLRPFNLTSTQLMLVAAMARGDLRNISSIAAFLAVDRTTLTAAIKLLERRSLVKVSANPTDRRLKTIALTSAGQELLRRALPPWETMIRSLQSRLSAAEQESMRRHFLACNPHDKH
jgi:DNA-binding MarR family transcriptional regulator